MPTNQMPAARSSGSTMSGWLKLVRPALKLMNVLTTATDASAMAVAAGTPSSRTSPEDWRVKSPLVPPASGVPVVLMSSPPGGWNVPERSYQAHVTVATPPPAGSGGGLCGRRPGPVRPDLERLAAGRAGPRGDGDRDGEAVVRERRVRRVLTPAGGGEVVHLGLVGGREPVAAVGREARLHAGPEHRDAGAGGGLGEHDRAVRADHLAADLHPQGRGARQVGRGDGAAEAD